MIDRKKTLIILILLLGIIVSLYGKNLKSVSAQGETTVCPLNKMVTVGSLMDQSFISVSNLLLEVDGVLTNSAQAYQTAGDLIKTSKEDYKPENCQSSCQPDTEIEPCGGYPIPGVNFTCTAGYTCTKPLIPYFLKGSDILNSPFGPRQNCKNLPNNLSPIHEDNYYAVFNWYLNFWNSGRCIVDWSCEVPTCDENDCSGDACQPCLAEGFVGNIATNRIAIEGAHQNIKDFFEENITKFPKPDNYTIFGEFCEHPILSKLCTSCPGTLLVLVDACQSEFYALIALQDKAMSNVKKCDIIKPDDLFEGKQGEILFRCKDVRPSPVKQCWQDDFFCCTAEE